MFGIDTQDIQDLKIVDVKVGNRVLKQSPVNSFVFITQAGSKTVQSLIPALTATNPSNSRSVQDMLSRAGTAA